MDGYVSHAANITQPLNHQMASAQPPTLQGMAGHALFLGLVYGIVHVVGPDHLGTLITLSSSVREPVKAFNVGGAWGLGHAPLFTSMTSMVQGGQVAGAGYRTASFQAGSMGGAGGSYNAYGGAGAMGGMGGMGGGNVMTAGAGGPETCCGGYANAGECAGTCGGAEAACCEAAGAVVNTNWQYVGSGGSYTPVQNYNYVGQGAGTYEKETTVTYYGWRFRKCCLGLLCLLLVPALLYLLSQLFDFGGEVEAPETPAPVIEQPIAPTPAPEPKPLFDCAQAGLWSLAKKDWCCKHYGRGCTTHPPPTTPRPTPPPTTPPHTTPAPPRPVPVPIPAPVANPLPAPSPPPVANPLPTPAPPAVTSLPYDCNADYLDCYHCLMARWSVSKRAWCCAHARRGCPTGAPPATPAPPAPLPYDCNAGFANWQAGWSVGKKQWCCQHTQKGCAPATTSLPYDCNAGFANWNAGWSVGKKQWCCQHVHKGCAPPAPPAIQPLPEGQPVSTTSCPPMDCNVAFNNWKMAWTKEKQQYCCQHEGKACP